MHCECPGMVPTFEGCSFSAETHVKSFLRDVPGKRQRERALGNAARRVRALRSSQSRNLNMQLGPSSNKYS